MVLERFASRHFNEPTKQQDASDTSGKCPPPANLVREQRYCS